MIRWTEIRDVIETARAFGTEQLPDGTVLLGRVPHIGSAAFFHELYAPLTEAELRQLEEALGLALPRDFAEFLRVMNGCSLFSGALAIHGLRRNYIRTVAASRQPFSLLDTNRFERPRGAPADAVFVGSYKADGSQLAIEGVSVYRTPRRMFERVQSWRSFGEALLGEVRRLATCFDGEGRRIA